MKRINIVIVFIAVGFLTGCGNYGRMQSNQNTKLYETVEDRKESLENIIEVPKLTERPDVVVTEAPVIIEQPTPEVTETPMPELTETPVPESTEIPISTPEPTEVPVEIQPTGGSFIDKELNKREQEAAEIEKKLQEANTESDRNQLSAEIYALWDEELNTIWKQLMSKMNENDKKALREEEKEWISEKDEEIQKLIEEEESGSILQMTTNLKAAELTKARVYVLANYLKEYE